jgi:hypothetical protein
VRKTPDSTSAGERRVGPDKEPIEIVPTLDLGELDSKTLW